MELTPATRRSERHDVQLACEVISSSDDTPQLLWATDLSTHGMFLEGGRSLAVGSALVVCFQPPVWWRLCPLMVFAQVTRSSAGRRLSDASAGVGIRFLDLEHHEEWALRRWLRPRPVATAQPRVHFRTRWSRGGWLH